MSTPISGQDIAAIKANAAEQARCGLDSDWDGFVDLYTDDAIVLPTDAPVVEGKKAARRFLDEWPPVKAYDVQIVKVEGRDDFAWAWGTFTETVEPEPGKSLSMKGKWTSSYRKQPDGSWLATSLIWNLDEPMKAI